MGTTARREVGNVAVGIDVKDVVSAYQRLRVTVLDELGNYVGPYLSLGSDAFLGAGAAGGATKASLPVAATGPTDQVGSTGPTDQVGSTGPTDQSGPTVPTGQAGPTDPLTQLRGVLDSLDSLTETDWHELAGRAAHDALDLLEQVDRRLSAVRSQVLSAVEADGTWALDGSRTFSAWLRKRTDSTGGSAAREVRHSRALRDHLPRTRAALEAGEIGQEHVRVLVREAIVTERLRTQLLDAELGEAFLVEQATVMDAGTFTRLVKSWAIAADPEAADRNWRDAGAKEELTVAPTLGGYHVAGWLDETSGQVVSTALNAHMGRKANGDDRTPSQRRAAALVALAHQSLDEGRQGEHARVRPHVTVTTSLDTLRALVGATGSAVPPRGADGRAPQPGAAVGVDADATLTAPGGPRDPGAPVDDPSLFELSPEARAWVENWEPGQDHVISTAIDHEAMVGVTPATLEDGTPLAPALFARLLCESALSRVVFGPESTVLDVGREKRIFPANQAKAIIARDRHCQFPGCDEPPGFGEIHHSLQWYKDHGPTSVEHGILLCWHHHDWVHSQTITIIRSAGRWHFCDRNGRPITARSGTGDGPPSWPENDDDEPPPTLQG